MSVLSDKLKEGRRLSQLSLREVEAAIGFSNAYINMLEKGKVNNPSADVLGKLAVLYKMDFNELVVISKTTENVTNTHDEWLKTIAVYSMDLSTEQRNELINYAKYILFRNGVEEAK